MSRKKLVAIVGRPNVGKSTFFNKICGRRISIVKDEPGVTRDRIFADAEWCGYNFMLVDTGGIVFEADDDITKHIRKQVEIAVDTADVILFFVDAKQGLVASDYDIADFLRRSKKSVVLVVNKLDKYETEHMYDFYQLGLGDPQGISCEQSLGLGDLLDVIVGHFDRQPAEESSAVKIAVVGRPNVGKSSLVNRILGFERTIVSPIAGTTRDAIDTPFTYDGKDYIIIDTAGMRRQRGIELESVEAYSVMRAISAIQRADIVFAVVDAEAGLTEQDVRIIGLANDELKPCIIVMNKWDLVDKDSWTINAYNEQLDIDLSFMSYYVPIYLSALTGKRVEKLMALADRVMQNAERRITTGTLNELIASAVAANEPVAPRGQRVKIFYATQADVRPPRFVIMVSDASLVHFSYRRYLENCLRKAVDFEGVPIHIVFRNNNDE